MERTRRGKRSWQLLHLIRLKSDSLASLSPFLPGFAMLNWIYEFRQGGCRVNGVLRASVLCTVVRCFKESTNIDINGQTSIAWFQGRLTVISFEVKENWTSMERGLRNSVKAKGVVVAVVVTSV